MYKLACLMSLVLGACGSDKLNAQVWHTPTPYGDMASGTGKTINATCAPEQLINKDYIKCPLQHAPEPGGYYSANGICAATWTLRGCKCIPLDALWISKSQIVDKVQSWYIDVPAPKLPYLAIQWALNGNLDTMATVWNIYNIPDISHVLQTGETVIPRPLVDSQISLDTYTDCPVK